MHQRLIITAASSGYEKSLFALIGSINCNWPGHPPVHVYDLGLSTSALELLKASGITVQGIPQFAPHWRADFTWKVWCLRDSPAQTCLWLDAGVCILRPLEEAFRSAETMGYFAVALYNHPVLPSVPEPLIKNSRLDSSMISEMISISANVLAMCKQGVGQEVLEEAYQLCLDHENLRATAPPHRHDQALLTLMLYKYFGAPVLADYHVYAHHYPTGPGVQSRQKVWVHRRKMLDEDVDYFKRYLAVPGKTHRPTSYFQRPPLTRLMKMRIAVAKLRGRYPGDDVVDLDRVVLHGIKD